MPIDRARGGNVVRATVAEFARRERMSLTITPEGTRSRVKEWKLGFYYIAVEAKVPIVPVALNYAERLVMILPPVPVTGDVERELPLIKALYSKSMARHPENF
jgi:1-acyl-sn-glycerol-3-phosphate acyltransferase